MRHVASVALGAILLAACGKEGTHPAASAAPAVDPEIASLRAQLAQARAERDAALARLHAALQRKPSVVRVVVREAAPMPSRAPQAESTQPEIFRTLSTSTASP